MTKLVPTVDSVTWLFPTQTMTALGNQLTPTDSHIDGVIEQYLIDNPPDTGGAVASVNGSVGAVVLDASDVGALADDYAPATADISDASTIGKALLTAVDAAAARDAIGAGTGSGTGAVASVNSQTGAVVLTASDVGAKDASYAPAAADISDATTVGKAVLIATDAAAARTAIGAGTSSLALGTTSSTAKSGDYAPNAAAISDASAIGRTVLTAADGPAIRTAIGAGTSSLVVGTASGTAADAATTQTALAAQPQMVIWDDTTSTWPTALTTAVCRFFISTGYPAATTPTGLSLADKWFRDGDAA